MLLSREPPIVRTIARKCARTNQLLHKDTQAQQQKWRNKITNENANVPAQISNTMVVTLSVSVRVYTI